MKKLTALTLSLLLVTFFAYADTKKTAESKPATPATLPKVEAAKGAGESPKTGESHKTDSSIELEIQQLKDLVQTLSRELAEQREALREQQAKTEALTKEMVAAHLLGSQQALPAPATGQPAPPSFGAATAQPQLDAVAAEVRAAGTAPQEKKEEGPTSLRFKGITLTPGGFFVAESVWRSHALSADINTPFNNIPFNGSSQAKVSEWNASGRQSRISMLAEGKLSRVKIGGYYEADFLSAGVTSNNNGSNSYTFRQRQFWAQAAFDNGWTVTGGQMWSLVTETKKGVNNRTEATTMTIDAQYHVGFSWARQYGFRVAKSFNDKVWLAFAVEGAQTTFAARGNSNNFLMGAAGASGGLFNATANYTFNKTPDFIVKAAFEPGWGHYEIFGVVRVFRARIFPDATATPSSAAGAFNDSRTAGGIGINARAPLFNKKLDAGLHLFAGDGINRYGAGGLPDASVRPNGTLAPIRGAQGLGTLEFHLTPRLDIYFNGGAEYAARTAFLNAAGTAGVGYGSPLFNNSGCSTETLPGNQFTPGSLSNCAGDTRVLVEGTTGFWHRFYRGEKGTMQWGMQYSYFVRNAWAGVSSVAPSANENMLFTSFRYFLP